MPQSGPPTGSGAHPPLPPVDAARLEEVFRKVAGARKPPGGWPGKPPKEVCADEEAGEG